MSRQVPMTARKRHSLKNYCHDELLIMTYSVIGSTRETFHVEMYVCQCAEIGQIA